jgi:hypothetical protein
MVYSNRYYRLTTHTRQLWSHRAGGAFLGQPPSTTANFPRQKPTAGCPPWRRDRRHLGISGQRTVERFAVVLGATVKLSPQAPTGMWDGHARGGSPTPASLDSHSLHGDKNASKYRSCAGVDWSAASDRVASEAALSDGSHRIHRRYKEAFASDPRRVWARWRVCARP